MDLLLCLFSSSVVFLVGSADVERLNELCEKDGMVDDCCAFTWIVFWQAIVCVLVVPLVSHI